MTNNVGNYLICESVEVDSARVDIEDLDKANENTNPDIADLETLTRGGTGKNNTVQSSDYRNSRKWYNIPNNPEDITGGYLLEIEISSRYNNEPCGFVTRNGQAMVIKSPDPASKAEVNYIADYFQQAEDAIKITRLTGGFDLSD